MQPAGHHLAEFNFGVLRHDWDDPRVADFADNVDRVNALAERADGFVWRLTDAEMDAEQKDRDGALGGNPRMASTLSVWRDAESLCRFAFATVHRQFYARAHEWFEPDNSSNLVLWWVPEGARPGVADGVARFEHWKTHGDTDHAFGWRFLGLGANMAAAE